MLTHHPAVTEENEIFKGTVTLNKNMLFVNAIFANKGTATPLLLLHMLAELQHHAKSIRGTTTQDHVESNVFLIL